MHKQKPVFRIKNTHLSGDESVKRELMEALEAVVHLSGDESDSLIMMRCKAALDRARRNP